MVAIDPHNEKLYREHREATRLRTQPEPIYDFAARVGLPADEPILVTRSAFGQFAKAPDGAWGWVTTD